MTAGPALTTADVARALIESDLIPRYMEYARLSPSMNPAETIEHVAATWAPFVLARLAPAVHRMRDTDLRCVVDGEIWPCAAARAAAEPAYRQELQDAHEPGSVGRDARRNLGRPAAAEPAEEALRDAAHLRSLNEIQDARRIIVGLLDAFDERWTGTKRPPPVYYRAEKWLDAYLAAHPAPEEQR